KPKYLSGKLTLWVDSTRSLLKANADQIRLLNKLCLLARDVSRKNLIARLLLVQQTLKVTTGTPASNPLDRFNDFIRLIDNFRISEYRIYRLIQHETNRLPPVECINFSAFCRYNQLLHLLTAREIHIIAM